MASAVPPGPNKDAGFSPCGSWRVPSLPAIADPPDRVRSVVAHQQRAIRTHRYAYRPSPHVAVREHEACQEVFVLAAGVAGLVQRHADYLVAHAHRLVPRAVLGGENVSLIL